MIDTRNVFGALRAGRYLEAWPIYEQRPERRAHRAHKFGFPEWQGEDLTGQRLLVWHEQGFGDGIMMARFVPLLRAGEITYLCQGSLGRLFSHFPVTVQPQSDPRVVGVAHHDYWISNMSLPYRCGTTLENLPQPPYLFGRARPHGGIGVFWRGREIPDPGRSLPDDMARVLLGLPGAISLQPEDTGAADFQDTADIIAGLDLVISIDSAVAHLAGAMGKPLMLLLPHAYDWRWLAGRSDSPWYPSARLFIQPEAGAWGPVVREVCEVANRYSPAM